VRKNYDFSKGRRGAVIPSPGKTRITIMLDDDVIEHFRESAEAEGIGYQTKINSVLRAATMPAKGRKTVEKPVTEAALRKILREELREAG
jgi:BrnA antitoxin of type II toxin-antitoxin system